MMKWVKTRREMAVELVRDMAKEAGIKPVKIERIEDRQALPNGHHRVFILVTGENNERYWAESTD